MPVRSQHLLVISTLLLTLTAGALALLGISNKLSVNSAEWCHIRETGLPTAVNKLTWTDWQSNPGTVVPFNAFQPEHQPNTLPEFRIGVGRTLLHHFYFYQGRYQEDGTWQPFPALGPESGTHIQWRWPLIALGLAAAGIIALIRNVQPDQTSAAGVPGSSE